MRKIRQLCRFCALILLFVPLQLFAQGQDNDFKWIGNDLSTVLEFGISLA